MIAKEDIMKILDLDTADYDTLQGIAELQRRTEQAHGLLTEHKIRTATDRFSGDNADDPLTVLTEIDSIIDEKRDILKNAAIDLKVTDWDDIKIEEEREWLIRYWLPANTVTMFTGDGGMGKSWLTLQAACQIACGYNKAFLNPSFDLPSDADESVQPKHIIFATYEDEPEEIKRRLGKLAHGMSWIAESMSTIKQHLHIVDMRGKGSVWGPGIGHHIANTGDLLPIGEALRSICEEKQARLLVMDPLSGAFGGNENDRTAVYDFISSFRKWGDTAKCAILVIGHLPKGKEAREAGFSGSTAWEASVRSLWKLGKRQLDPKKNEPDFDREPHFVLEHIKSNYAKLQPDVFLGKKESGWWIQVEDEHAAIDAYNQYQEHWTTEDEDDDNPYDDSVKL